MDYLRLIRYKNLIFIALLQWLMYYAVVMPIQQTIFLAVNPAVWQPWCLQGYQLLMLIVATVLIAAGGYVINDYFDTRIDLLNRPDKLIVNRTIAKKTASLIHAITTGIGVVVGVALAVILHNLTLGLIMVMTPGLLWFYSASYKRQFILGNVIVSLCAAFVPLTVAIASNAMLTSQFGDILQDPQSKLFIASIYAWICGFAIFAFLLTFIREIIKDMEDEYGDKEMECHTIPVVLGDNKAKIVVYSLIGLTLLLVALFYVKFISTFGFFGEATSTASLRYLVIGVVVPLLFLVYFVLKAKSPDGYHTASICCKIVMILGSLYSLVFYFLVAKAQGLPVFDLFYIAQPQ